MENPKRPLLEAAITSAIIDSFRDVHRAFGFGYREYIYSLAMERDLIAKGFRVDREVAVMVYYRGEPLAPQTVDMIVNKKVIVENKAVERLRPDINPSCSVISARPISRLGWCFILAASHTSIVSSAKTVSSFARNRDATKLGSLIS